MDAVNLNKNTIDGWWSLLKLLNPETKLELASRLIDSLKKSEPSGEEEGNWRDLYGSWADEELSAEDFINLIRSSRFVNREIESFD